MLQFWKKRGQNETQKQPNPELSNNNQGLVDKLLNNSKPLLISAFVDENVFDIGEYELNKPRSRLYKTLKEILEDKSSTKSLQYFIQFMETQNVSSQLIYCWLDIQAFKDDVVQFNKTNHVNNIVPNNRVDQDNLSLTSSTTTTTEDDTNSSCSSLAEKSAGNKQQQLIVDTALQIFKKYLSQEAQNTNFINLSETHRTEIIETMCDLKKLFQGHIFDNIQRDIETKMDLEYFPQFYASDFYCKYQIDVLTTSDLVVLDDLLYNETALFYFMDYLEQENCRHFLEFWIAATNFQQQLEQQNEFLNKNEAQDDAIVLYDKYFSLQAHCPLGFGDVVRCGVEQEICGENNGDLQMNCFYLPIKIVEYVLDKNFLKSFLGSQLYYKYLSELINSSSSSTNCNNNNVMETESVGRKSTNSNNNQSDCGSERSYNTNSTFLALEINNIDQKTKKDEKINNNNHNKSAEVMMSIDTRLLCDPDALWKRKTRRNNANLGGNNRSVLSCGRVTSLGKFITDLEPCQPPSNSKLRSVMKKIVNFDDEFDERKKEEMAWQVAEMIVKDITNITLSQQPNNN